MARSSTPAGLACHTTAARRPTVTLPSQCITLTRHGARSTRRNGSPCTSAMISATVSALTAKQDSIATAAARAMRATTSSPSNEPAPASRTATAAAPATITSATNARAPAGMRAGAVIDYCHIPVPQYFAPQYLAPQYLAVQPAPLHDEAPQYFACPASG